ncbi:MAG: sensor domain-containing diguanylate cyclase [Cyanobacteria bacterium P01_A01_bin.135]
MESLSTSPADFDLRVVADDALAELHRRTGFDLWMVTRRRGDSWIILQVEDHSYNMAEGTVLRWTDSFCCQMVTGRGPAIAPTVLDVEAYRCAPIGQSLQIGAYAGIPLKTESGTLIGTLCAIHPTPLPDSIRDEFPLMVAIAKLISGLLAAELAFADISRRNEKLEAEVLKDELTGLFNRRAWNRFLAVEAQRSQRVGSELGIIVIDLDNLKQMNDTQGHLAGDDYICRAARVIQEVVVQRDDYSARLGGDEFAILCVDCDAEQLARLAKQLCFELQQRHVEASIGVAARQPFQPLTSVWEAADRAMYDCKQGRCPQNCYPRDRECPFEISPLQN